MLGFFLYLYFILLFIFDLFYRNELLRLIAKYKKFVKYAKILTSLKNEEENDRLDNQVN